MTETLVATDGLECLVAVRYCTTVAPDDTWTDGLAFLVNAYESVHLVTYTYCAYLLEVSLLCHSLSSVYKFVPPHFWLLLCPSWLWSADWCLSIWILG